MTHTLPPLNPMHRAPRDGTRIVVMTKQGEIVGVTWERGNWELPVPSVYDKPHDYLWESDLLGWWPMPEVRE